MRKHLPIKFYVIKVELNRNVTFEFRVRSFFHYHVLEY